MRTKTKAFQKEYMLTSHTGTWSYSNLTGLNSLKEHGLFVHRIPEFGNEPYLLLSSLNESLEKDGKAIDLGTRPKIWKEANVINPYFFSGTTSTKITTTMHRFGNVLLSKEILFVEGEHRLMIKYTLLSSNTPLTLKCAPLLAFRKVSDTTYSNDNCNFQHGEPENGVSFKMYAGFPAIHIQCSNSVNYTHRPHWIRGFIYANSRETVTEDLYNPGTLATQLYPNVPLILQVSLHPTDTKPILTVFQSQKQKITESKTANDYLKKTARQFMASKEKQYYLLSDLPFTMANATEVFKAMPGLKLALKDCHTCVSAEHNLINELKRRIENKGKPRLTKGFDDPKILFWACWSFITIHKNDELTYNFYMDLVVQIIQVIQKNKILGLKLNRNGLIKMAARKEQQSASHPLINTRSGYLVEMNAIWYNAVKCAENYVEDEGLKHNLQKLSSSIQSSFVYKFWNEDRNFLYDYVDKIRSGEEVRSNMLFAISQQYSPLNQKQKNQVLDTISSHLLTPLGLRSLSPESDFYAGRNTGIVGEKSLNGSSELWLLASFTDALIRVKGLQGYQISHEIKTRIKKMVLHKKGNLPNLHTGNPPYASIAKSANLLATAETARLFHSLKTYKRHLANNSNATNFDFKPFNKANNL